MAKKKEIKKITKKKLGKKPGAKRGKSKAKRVLEKETRQLIWFFATVLILFAAFLIPYFYVENQKVFEYKSINWAVEEYGDLTIYHGRFLALNSNTNHFNIFLRNDPREIDIPTSGNFISLSKNTAFSFTREVNDCRGDIPRVTVDLANFFLQGVGVNTVTSAAPTPSYAEELNLSHMNCASSSQDQGVVIFQMGEQSSIEQSKQYPYCYTLTLKDCKDIVPVEEFMVTLVSAVNTAYEILENQIQARESEEEGNQGDE